VLPWQDPIAFEADNYGFADDDFFRLNEALEGAPEFLVPVIPLAAAYVSRIVDPVSGSFPIGYDEQAPVMNFEMIMAAASVGPHSEDLNAVFGQWLATGLGLYRGQTLRPQLRLIDHLPRLEVDVREQPPTWRYRSYLIDASTGGRLRSLGWEPDPTGQLDGMPVEYGLPAETTPPQAGHIAAQTITEVDAWSVRELLWHQLSIGEDPGDTLRFIIENGIGQT
jgi:hypothetical protein